MVDMNALIWRVTEMTGIEFKPSALELLKERPESFVVLQPDINQVLSSFFKLNGHSCTL